jgi:hypothetical protein
MGYQLIQTVTLATNAASIEFAGIPQDGLDLLLSVSSKSLQSTVFARMNNDSNAANYPNKLVEGSGTSVASYALDNIRVNSGGYNQVANTFGNTSVYISDYSLSNKSKSISVDGVTANNAPAAILSMLGVRYTPTAAITSIQVGFTGGMESGSTFSLYKITAD